MNQQHFVFYTHPKGGSTALFCPFTAIDVVPTDDLCSVVLTNGSSTLMVESLTQKHADSLAMLVRDWASSVERLNLTGSPGINLNAALDGFEKEGPSRILVPKLVE